MREDKAKGLAFGTGAVILGAVVLFAAIQQDGTAAPDPEASPATAPSPVDVAVPATGDGLPTAAVEPVPAPSPAAPAQDSLILAGAAVYDEVGCAACHSIAGEGSTRSPLDGVGARLDADEIWLWIVDPQAARPGIRKPAFDDLPTEDVDALVAFLHSLVE